MKKLFYLFIFFLPFFLNSCDKEPYAYFDTKDGSRTFGVGENVQFISNCRNAFNYEWDFGDGTPDGYVGVMSRTSHTYDSPGDYTVTLTVLSARGQKSDSYTLRLTIIETGDVSFWVSQACTGGPVRVYFLDKTDYITSYYLLAPPDCDAHGCAYFAYCPPGLHHFYAENDDYYWEGRITVCPGYCNRKKLSISSKGEENVDDEETVAVARVKEK